MDFQSVITARVSMYAKDWKDQSAHRFRLKGEIICTGPQNRPIICIFLNLPDDDNMIWNISGHPIMRFAIRQHETCVLQHLFACKHSRDIMAVIYNADSRFESSSIYKISQLLETI